MTPRTTRRLATLLLVAVLALAALPAMAERTSPPPPTPEEMADAQLAAWINASAEADAAAITRADKVILTTEQRIYFEYRLGCGDPVWDLLTPTALTWLARHGITEDCPPVAPPTRP